MAHARATGGKPIDVNRADPDELALIEGIDEERAQLIVEYRDAHGAFESWDEFQNVPGIGPVLRERAEAAAIIGDGEPELGESPEDREVDELIAIAELDREAAAAYEVAAAGLPSAEAREQLMQFRGDHLRHAVSIGVLLQARGLKLPEEPGRAETSAMADLAAAAVEMGTKAALLAMVSNERLTNGTYEAALQVVTDEDARGVLQRNFADEQRHLKWLQDNRDRAFEIAPRPGASP